MHRLEKAFLVMVIFMAGGWELKAFVSGVLEIVDESVDTAEPSIVGATSGCRVVMMNPGSSRPLNRGWESEVRSS